MTFSTIYDLYTNKIEKKGRTKEELNKVIEWLTGFTSKELQNYINDNISFEACLNEAKINSNATFITGNICGHTIEDIKDPLIKKIRYLDKLVDELAKGKPLAKIFRTK